MRKWRDWLNWVETRGGCKLQSIFGYLDKDQELLQAIGVEL